MACPPGRLWLPQTPPARQQPPCLRNAYHCCCIGHVKLEVRGLPFMAGLCGQRSRPGHCKHRLWHIDLPSGALTDSCGPCHVTLRSDNYLFSRFNAGSSTSISVVVLTSPFQAAHYAKAQRFKRTPLDLNRSTEVAAPRSKIFPAKTPLSSNSRRLLWSSIASNSLCNKGRCLSVTAQWQGFSSTT